MSRRVAALAGALVLVGALVAAVRWWAGDERVVRSRLNGLAAALSAPEGEADLARVARIAELRGYLAPDVTVTFGSQQMVSRDALVALVARFTPPPGGFVVSFVDATITLDDAGTGANVHLTAMLTSREAAGDELVDAREATVSMSKQDGIWVVAAVEATDTLQRP